MPAVCPVQAVLQEGLIASHQAQLLQACQVPECPEPLSPWPLHCWRQQSWHATNERSALFREETPGMPSCSFRIRLPGQAGLNSFLFPIEWRFAPALHTKAERANSLCW